MPCHQMERESSPPVIKEFEQVRFCLYHTGDVCPFSDVKISTALSTSKPEASRPFSSAKKLCPDRVNLGKCIVLTLVRFALGTNRCRLLQCIRDPSQPSSAAERSNLAAYARPG